MTDFLSGLQNFGTGPGSWPGYEALAPMQAMKPITPLSMTIPSIVPVGGDIPGVGGPQAAGGWFGIEGLGKNVGTLKGGIDTLAALGNLWNGYQANKLAKDSFNFQKGIMDTNIANQIKAYNLSIDDKFRSRAVVEGMSPAERDALIEKNKARDERRG